MIHFTVVRFANQSLCLQCIKYNQFYFCLEFAELQFYWNWNIFSLLLYRFFSVYCVIILLYFIYFFFFAISCSISINLFCEQYSVVIAVWNEFSARFLQWLDWFWSAAKQVNRSDKIMDHAGDKQHRNVSKIKQNKTNTQIHTRTYGKYTRFTRFTRLNNFQRYRGNWNTIYCFHNSPFVMVSFFFFFFNLWFWFRFCIWFVTTLMLYFVFILMYDFHDLTINVFESFSPLIHIAINWWNYTHKYAFNFGFNGFLCIVNILLII